METGIHTISADEYHALPMLSCSLAKTLLSKSPYHAWLESPLNPDRKPNDEATRLDIGTSAHALLLEGVDSVVVCDFDDWRKKEAQAMRDDARAAGKIPLLSRQYADVQAMASIAQDAALKQGLNLSTGKPEQTVIWQESGIDCRARTDWLSGDHDLILDYKTTALTNPAAFMRAIGSNGYDVQDAFYRRGVAAVTGKEPDFMFLVQETESPYSCYFVELSATYREIGQLKVKKSIKLWETCVKHNNWPGYPKGIMEAEAMPWQLAEAETIAAELELFDKDAPGAKEAFLFGSVAGDKGGKVNSIEEFDR